MPFLRFRPLLVLCAIVAALVLIVADADAQRRSNAGSRGSKTFAPPPVTQTAPTQARPIERTMTQPTQPGAKAATGAPAAPAAAGGGLFNRPGLFGGLAAGFLGAGLIGMLFGHGLTGGLGGMASILGLLLQVGLVAMVGYFLWSWWQRRSQPAMAGGPSMREATGGPRPMGQGALSYLGGLGGSSAPAAGGANADVIGTTPADFDQFERILGDVQTAFGAEDLGRLRKNLTPEMLSYFAEDLAENTSRGVVNRISDVKLLQGDLAEAWREGDVEYATVAMRYAINNQLVERASNRVVEGGPGEVTEVWTFMRVGGGAWLLSAIQQA